MEDIIINPEEVTLKIEQSKRKRRLTRKEMEIFNRFFIYHRDSLKELSNEKIAKCFFDVYGITISPVTVRANKNKWYIDNETQELKRIPEDIFVI